MQQNIRFMALGGQDERGKNLFVLEINKDLFILDAGIKFPDKGILGVDVVIPKLDFLKEHKNQIKGIFVTNPSAYNSSGINYLIKEMDLPIYCNDLTATILKIKAQRFRNKNKDYDYHILKDKDIIKFENTSVEVFSLTASSPQTLGFAFHTDLGAIVYAGEYLIDGQEKTAYSTDFSHLTSIGDKGVLAFISDTECASRMDFTAPDHKIERFISAPFKEKKIKIVVGIFEEDVFKLGEIIAQAKENNRKIAVYGRTLTTILETKHIREILDINDSHFFTVEEYMKSENGVLIIAGNGDGLYSKLDKIANGNDDVVEFHEKDLIILATPPAPGVEKRHAAVLDELARTDARVIALTDRNIWVMHSSYEDIKVMTAILKPKYFVPVRALYKDFLRAESAAIEAGVKPENIGLIDNGQILLLSKKHLAISEQTIKTGDVYVDGLGIGDIGNVVLNERKQLATDGVIIVGASMDSRNKELVSLLDIQMRGVLYIKEDNPIFKILHKTITDILVKGQALYREQPSAYDLNEIKREIVSKVRSEVKQESGKQPIVLAIINEIDEKEYHPVVRQTRNIVNNNRRNLAKTKSDNNSKKPKK